MDSLVIDFPLRIISRSDGTERSISVALFSVNKIQEDMYECKYQIVGIDNCSKPVFAVTPLQANYLALHIISAEMWVITRSYLVVDGITGAALPPELFQIGVR